MEATIEQPATAETLDLERCFGIGKLATFNVSRLNGMENVQLGDKLVVNRSGRPRLGVHRVRLPGRALEQGVRLAGERLQRVERGVRHPAGAPGFEDGDGRSRLGDECGHPDRVGPGIHPGSLRHALRRVGALAGRRLVLSRARRRATLDWNHGALEPVTRTRGACP